MAGKPQTTEAKLALLATDEGPPELKVLIAALGDRANLVVAKAATVCGRYGISDSVPHLRAAYDRLSGEDRVKVDRGCLAKIALIKALYELDFVDPAFYRAALSLVQMEPGFGKPEDKAVDVRCIAAAGFAYANSGRGGSISVLMDALLDPEPAVRIAAVRAIASLESDAAVALLRFKALSGDPAAEVTGECLPALLRISSAADDGLGLVIRFLDHRNPAVSELAALALGESRRADAVEALIVRWKGSHPEDRPILAQALAIARTNEAFRFLYDLLEQGVPRDAALAVEGLSMYRDDPAIRNEVEPRVLARGDRGLTSVLAREWNS